MFETILELLLALSLTLVIETAFAFTLGIRKKDDFICVITINVITNVTLNLVLIPIRFALNGYEIALYSTVIALETLVVVCEYLYYRKKLEFKQVHPLLISIILNCASFALGIIVFYLIYG